jgi:Na+/H+ antiporter NhaD/arsenite permease-like protein
MVPLIESIAPGIGASLGFAEGSPELRQLVVEPLYWSLALGACLGGNGSLVGASANVVISQIARRNNNAFTFMQFTRYGFPIMVLTLVIASGYLYVRYIVLAGLA